MDPTTKEGREALLRELIDEMPVDEDGEPSGQRGLMLHSAVDVIARQGSHIEKLEAEIERRERARADRELDCAALLTERDELRAKVATAIAAQIRTGKVSDQHLADAAIRVVVEACCAQLMATMLKAGVKVIGPGDAVMAMKALLPEDPTLANKEPTP